MHLHFQLVQPATSQWAELLHSFMVDVHSTQSIRIALNKKLNKHPGPFALFRKLDAPLGAWAWSMWALVLVGPILLGFMSVQGIDHKVGIGLLVFLAFWVLRSVLVSKGAVKSDLNAITKGIGLSFVFTFLIASLLFLALLGSFVITLELLGVWDTYYYVVPLGAQIAIFLTLIGVPLLVGWRLKGRSVFRKHIQQVDFAA